MTHQADHSLIPSLGAIAYKGYYTSLCFGIIFGWIMFFVSLSSVSLNLVQPLVNGIFYGIYMGTCYTVIMGIWHKAVRPIWKAIGFV